MNNDDRTICRQYCEPIPDGILSFLAAGNYPADLGHGKGIDNVRLNPVHIGRNYEDNIPNNRGLLESTKGVNKQRDALQEEILLCLAALHASAGPASGDYGRNLHLPVRHGNKKRARMLFRIRALESIYDLDDKAKGFLSTARDFISEKIMRPAVV